LNFIRRYFTPNGYQYPRLQSTWTFEISIPLLTRRQGNDAFRNIVSYIRTPASLKLPGILFEDVPRDLVESGVWTGKVDTSWIINETREQIVGYLVTNTARWDKSTSHRLSEDYVDMVRRFASEIDSSLGAG
jgi:hypothetical protein